MINKYKPPEYNTDIDDGIFSFPHLGNCVFHPSPPWHDKPRTDIIHYNDVTNSNELFSVLKFGTGPSSSQHKTDIVTIITRYWDCFCSAGTHRPILDFEFAIDTGTASPVCKYTTLT